MQVCEQYLTFPQHFAFDRLRFFHFYDHVSCCEYIGRCPSDLCTSGNVIDVKKIRPDTGTCFYSDLVTMIDRLLCRVGRQANPIFLWLDFLRASDVHYRSPLIACLTSSCSACAMSEAFWLDNNDSYRRSLCIWINCSKECAYKWNSTVLIAES